MDAPGQPAPTFIAGLRFTQHYGDAVADGRAELTDQLRDPASGQARCSVLATYADIYTGVLCAMVVAPRIALTVDLTLHVLGDVSADALDVAATILRSGRTLTVAEAVFTVAGSAVPVAVSHATFVGSPRPGDILERDRLLVEPARQALERPFPEALGAEVQAPGVVEMARVPYVQQPSGTIQGGAVALLGEVAATSLLGGRVVDLELRYLSAVRVGPAVTSTTALDATHARVEVRDAGNEGRLATVVLATVVP